MQYEGIPVILIIKISRGPNGARDIDSAFETRTAKMKIYQLVDWLASALDSGPRLFPLCNDQHRILNLISNS